MKKLEKLKKDIMDKAQLKADKTDRVARLEASLTTLKEEKDTAAAAGDMDKFQMAQRKEKDATDNIYMLKVQLDRMEGETDADINDAWTEYADDYAREMSKALATYHKHARELAKEYEAMVLKQNAALKEREDLAALLGSDNSSDNGLNAIADRFPLMYLPDSPLVPDIGGKVSVPELRFFLQSGIWAAAGTNTKSAETLNSIVRLKRSINHPEF